MPKPTAGCSADGRRSIKVFGKNYKKRNSSFCILLQSSVSFSLLSTSVFHSTLFFKIYSLLLSLRVKDPFHTHIKQQIKLTFFILIINYWIATEKQKNLDRVVTDIVSVPIGLDFLTHEVFSFYFHYQISWPSYIFKKLIKD